MSREEKLFEKLRRTKKGWRLRELEQLYVSHGFEKIEGGKHILFVHSKYPELRATVTRSGDLAIGYLTHAQRLIESLIKKEEGD